MVARGLGWQEALSAEEAGRVRLRLKWLSFALYMQSVKKCYVRETDKLRLKATTLKMECVSVSVCVCVGGGGHTKKKLTPGTRWGDETETTGNSFWDIQ